MIATVYNSKLNGKISAIPSKSVAHRLLILSALSSKKTTVERIYPSNDIEATLNCLKSLGAKFDSDSIIMEKLSHAATLNVGESGSTLRFLLPIVSAIGGEFEFICEGRLIDRPNEELYSVLQKHNVKVTHGKTIKTSGKLDSGIYEIAADVSSQYISGLLMALPLLNGDSEIVLTSKLSSKNYVDITISTLNQFGVEIKKTEKGFAILGNQEYNAKNKLTVEGDWSNGAFFLCACAIGGNVQIDNLDINSKQGDKRIMEILKDFGADVKIEEDVLIVSKNKMRALKIDVDNIIDLTPILAVLLSIADGESELYNVKRLRIKESDRVKSTVEMLNGLGVDAYETNDAIHIKGGKIKGGTINSHNDHRIVMAAAIAGLVAENPVIIENAQAVNKSYPTFFEDIKSLGGKVDVKI